MFFKLFLCGNCAIENDFDDSFINFKEDNKKALCQNNISNTKDIKSIVSTSDNNSIYNLEIIEYPYTFTNDDDINNGYKPNPLIRPKNLFLDNKNNYIEFGNFFHKIKPPNLFVKENRRNKEIISPELTEDNLLGKIKDTNYTNENENNNDIKDSKDTSLINNEDSIMNNKDFIENYNSNLNKIENVIKSNTKLNKIINEINIDCPTPDSNNFAIKNDNKPNLNIQEEKKIFNESVKKIEKLEKEKKEKNNENNKDKKPIKTKLKSNILKNVKFKNLNLKKLSSLGINEILQKTYTDFNTNFYNYNIKQSNKDKLLKRFKKIKDKTQTQTKSFDEPYHTENRYIFSKKDCSTPFINKYNGLITENNKKSHITKARKKYLSNTFLGDLLTKKKSHNYRNTVFGLNYKKKKYNFYKTHNKRTNITHSFYENPFSTIQKLN